MVDEPDNLVLRQLCEMREEIRDFRKGTEDSFRGVRRVQDQHTVHLESLEERFDMIREGTIGAINFASNADCQFKEIKIELDDMKKRISRLEQAK